MAEVILRSRIADAGLEARITVDSAGTGTWHTGHGADPRTRQALVEHRYPDPAGHTARRITPTWFADIDLVLAMDEANYVDLADLIRQGGIATDLTMIRSFDPRLARLAAPHPDLDVPDPYYGGPGGFTDVLGLIERAADGVVEHVRGLV